MTFNFRNWPSGLFDPFLERGIQSGRPRLVARWQRATDGKLACRWVRQPIYHPPN
jgi:hypothetical protein